MKKLIFGYTIAESRKAVIAAIYFVFAVVMLAGFVPAVGFEEAVLALVGPAYGVAGVFLAKNHSPDDLQKALEALKSAAISAVSFYVAVPDSTSATITMLITGVVMAIGVYWARNEGSATPGNGSPAVPRGP